MKLCLPERSLSTLDTVHNCDALALLRGLPSFDEFMEQQR